jgi:hypothetical protein
VNWRNEPALIVAVLLGIIEALSLYLLAVGAGIGTATAAGTAVAVLGLNGGAGVLIRQLVYGPQTVVGADDLDHTRR